MWPTGTPPLRKTMCENQPQCWKHKCAYVLCEYVRVTPNLWSTYIIGLLQNWVSPTTVTYCLIVPPSTPLSKAIFNPCRRARVPVLRAFRKYQSSLLLAMLSHESSKYISCTDGDDACDDTMAKATTTHRMAGTQFASN